MKGICVATSDLRLCLAEIRKEQINIFLSISIQPSLMNTTYGELSAADQANYSFKRNWCRNGTEKAENVAHYLKEAFQPNHIYGILNT